MDKLTLLLDSIDEAYRLATKIDPDVTAILLQASLKVSEKIEGQSRRSDRRRRAA